jgi:hypothetical protein
MLPLFCEIIQPKSVGHPYFWVFYFQFYCFSALWYAL